MEDRLSTLEAQVVEQVSRLQAMEDRIKAQVVEQGSRLQPMEDRIKAQVVEQGIRLQAMEDRIKAQVVEQGSRLQAMEASFQEFKDQMDAWKSGVIELLRPPSHDEPGIVMEDEVQGENTPAFQGRDHFMRPTCRIASVGSAGAAPTQPRPDIPKPFQRYLDKTRPHPLYRWIGTFIFAILFALRVYSIQGFYIVTFVMGIFILCALVDFLTPLVNPSLQTSDGPVLPSDEFKPFIRLLPEFVFWFDFTLAFCVAFVLTFFSAFDSHRLSWQELLIFWILYFIYIMTFQIGHMLKYKYIPFNIGKQKYGGKETVAGGGSLTVTGGEETVAGGGSLTGAGGKETVAGCSNLTGTGGKETVAGGGLVEKRRSKWRQSHRGWLQQKYAYTSTGWVVSTLSEEC